MFEELTYALITPYSLYKSRTGGIIGRLLTQAKADLLGMRMFLFSEEFVERFAKIICTPDIDPVRAAAWRKYLDENLHVANAWHYAPRCMVLLLGGPDAVRHLKDDVIGSFTDAPMGDTIRGTFGDYIRNEDKSIRHFEPAVITATTREMAVEHLRLFAEYSDADGGVLTHRIHYDNNHNIQTTLVLIKPDGSERRSRRPGAIIDTISRTGLKIVAARLLPMTVAMSEALYSPLKTEFVDSLRGDVARQVYARLHDAFPFPFTMHDAQVASDLLAERNATSEFNRIVQYMSGVNPEEIAEGQEKDTASRSSCLALLYEGPDAIRKVRSVLSGGDPTQIVPGGRSQFARELLRNGAQSSESPEEALREREIVGLADEQGRGSHFQRVIEEHLAARETGEGRPE